MYRLEYITVCHTLVQVKIKEYYSITVKNVRLGCMSYNQINTNAHTHNFIAMIMFISYVHDLMIIVIYVMLVSGCSNNQKACFLQAKFLYVFTHVHMVQACIRKQ